MSTFRPLPGLVVEAAAHGLAGVGDEHVEAAELGGRSSTNAWRAGLSATSSARPHAGTPRATSPATASTASPSRAQRATAAPSSAKAAAMAAPMPRAAGDRDLAAGEVEVHGQIMAEDLDPLEVLPEARMRLPLKATVPSASWSPARAGTWARA